MHYNKNKMINAAEHNIGYVSSAVTGRDLSHAEKIASGTATIGAMTALSFTTNERAEETKAAMSDVLKSTEGKKIVSDIVYEGVVKALNERARQN